MNVDAIDDAGASEKVLRAHQIHEHDVAVEERHPRLENRADDEVSAARGQIPARANNRRNDANRIAALDFQLLRQRLADRNRTLRRLLPRRRRDCRP